jgi:hypothetical protein
MYIYIKNQLHIIDQIGFWNTVAPIVKNIWKQNIKHHKWTLKNKQKSIEDKKNAKKKIQEQTKQIPTK